LSILLQAGELLNDPVRQTINHTINKIGAGSIATGLGIKAAENADLIEKGWGLTEYAAMIAMIGSLLFSVKLVLEITLIIENRINKRKV